MGQGVHIGPSSVEQSRLQQNRGNKNGQQGCTGPSLGVAEPRKGLSAAEPCSGHRGDKKWAKEGTLACASAQQTSCGHANDWLYWPGPFLEASKLGQSNLGDQAGPDSSPDGQPDRPDDRMTHESCKLAQHGQI